jgi:hypothetical protein
MIMVDHGTVLTSIRSQCAKRQPGIHSDSEFRTRTLLLLTPMSIARNAYARRAAVTIRSQLADRRSRHPWPYCLSQLLLHPPQVCIKVAAEQLQHQRRVVVSQAFNGVRPLR